MSDDGTTAALLDTLPANDLLALLEQAGFTQVEISRQPAYVIDDTRATWDGRAYHLHLRLGRGPFLRQVEQVALDGHCPADEARQILRCLPRWDAANGEWAHYHQLLRDHSKALAIAREAAAMTQDELLAKPSLATVEEHPPARPAGTADADAEIDGAQAVGATFGLPPDHDRSVLMLKTALGHLLSAGYVSSGWSWSGGGGAAGYRLKVRAGPHYDQTITGPAGFLLCEARHLPRTPTGDADRHHFWVHHARRHQIAGVIDALERKGHAQILLPSHIGHVLEVPPRWAVRYDPPLPGTPARQALVGTADQLRALVAALPPADDRGVRGWADFALAHQATLGRKPGWLDR